MKKTYIAPELKIHQVAMVSSLCAGSPLGICDGQADGSRALIKKNNRYRIIEEFDEE